MTITYRMRGGSVWEYADADPHWLATVGAALANGGDIDLTDHPGNCLRSGDGHHLIPVRLLDSIEVTP